MSSSAGLALTTSRPHLNPADPANGSPRMRRGRWADCTFSLLLRDDPFQRLVFSRPGAFTRFTSSAFIPRYCGRQRRKVCSETEHLRRLRDLAARVEHPIRLAQLPHDLLGVVVVASTRSSSRPRTGPNLGGRARTIRHPSSSGLAPLPLGSERGSLSRGTDVLTSWAGPPSLKQSPPSGAPGDGPD